MNQWINQFACLSARPYIHPSIQPIQSIESILIAMCATFLHSLLSIQKSMLGLYIYVQGSQNNSINCTHPPQKKSTIFSLEVKKDTPESVDLKLCLVDAGSAGLLGSELRTWSSRLLDWHFWALDLGLSEHDVCFGPPKISQFVGEHDYKLLDGTGRHIFRQICAADLSDFHMGDSTRHEQYARGNQTRQLKIHPARILHL